MEEGERERWTPPPSGERMMSSGERKTVPTGLADLNVLVTSLPVWSRDRAAASSFFIDH